MKLLLLADGLVGLEAFRRIAAGWREDLALVVTIGDSNIYGEAISQNIPATVFESEDQIIRQCVERKLTPDLGLMAWWPKIIKDRLINFPRCGFLNTHPSLLPYNRGKHYSFWALVEQAPFGVTIHRVDSGIDSGEIVAQRAINYGWEDTGKTLYEKAIASMIDLLTDIYPDLRTLNFPSRPQPAGGSFHNASELDAASEIFLDKTYSGRELLNLLRARTFPSYPACWFCDGGVEYEVRIEIRKRR